MSKLNELIKELCPDGVEFKQIKYIAEVGTGSSNGNEAQDDGEYPFFIRSQNVKRKNDWEYNEEAIIIPGEGAIGDIYHYMNGKYAIHQRVYRIHFTNKEVNVKFAFHYFRSCFKSFIMRKAVSATVKSIRKPMVEEFTLPILPLPVQNEIVRILDNFTELTTKLIMELTTELTARKKQYEYYRDTMFSCNKGTQLVKLKDIATEIYRGAGIEREQVTSGGIPCVRYGEIYTTYNAWFDNCVSHTQSEYVPNPKYFEYGDILFTIPGESVEHITKSIAYVGHDKCLAGEDIVVMKHKQNPKYLSYVLSTYYARQQKSQRKIKSKVVHFNVPSIENIEIPLPSLEVQERFANALDNFESICFDLKIGLPVEIEARKKQYELYRDTLLTFAETGNIILQTDRKNIIRLIQYVFGYAMVRLDDIAIIKRGGNFQKKDFCEKGVPCIHYGQIYTHFGICAASTLKNISVEAAEKSKKAVTGDIVMAVTSENVEDVCKCVAWVGDEGIAVSDHTAIIHHNQNAKYLSYYFHTSMFSTQKKKLAHGTKVIEVTPSKLNDILIPLPSIDEQNRIVGLLDRFDMFCNDISAGLPAEIEVRQKQYEYYRNKLLNFIERR